MDLTNKRKSELDQLWDEWTSLQIVSYWNTFINSFADFLKSSALCATGAWTLNLHPLKRWIGL